MWMANWSVDNDLKRLHVNVERLKNNKQIGVKYMHMQEVIKYAAKEEAEEIVKQKMEEVNHKMEEVNHKMEEVNHKMEEVNHKMEEAKHKMEEAKQKADAAKQEMEKNLKKNMKLTQILLDAERYDDIRRITRDKDYLKKMLEEFGVN